MAAGEPGPTTVADPHPTPTSPPTGGRDNSPHPSLATPDSHAELVQANEQLVLATLHARADADAARAALDEVVYTASLDPLTQLPTRALLLDRFAQAIQNAKRHGTHVALLFVDLDNFKLVNDTLGHAAGDMALQHIAQCIVASIREVDTVSRYGGDEFVVLLPEVSAEDDAVRVGEKLLRALGRSTIVADRAFRFTASVGISFYPTDGQDAKTLIEHADAAMYRAKRLGKASVCMYRDLVIHEHDALPQDASPPSHWDTVLLSHQHRHAELQEANERLVVAALTAQELQRAAEEAFARQAEFLTVVAHELRNPLAPIRSAAELLGRVSADELPRIKAMIERQVAQMSRIVEDLFDLRRARTGRLQLERSSINFADVIGPASVACRPAMWARQQEFVLTVVPDTLPVNGDAARLEQVVRNLLDNASKYTPKGGRIELSVVVDDATIVMTVADSGIGITPEGLPLVFEPFAQDRPAVIFHGGGLGLGLTVVRELVEAHDGSIAAHSAGSGKGSQFVVRVPLRRV